MKHKPSTDNIVISGGSIQATALAIGTGAKAQVRTTANPADSDPKQQLVQMIEELQAKLDQVSSQLVNRGELQDALTAVRGELKKDAPNKLTVQSVLSGVLSGVQSLSGIATAVQAIQSAAKAMLG